MPEITQLVQLIIKQHEAVQLELKRSRRVTRQLIKEVKTMNEANTAAQSANAATQQAIQDSHVALGNIASGFRSVVGVLVLHLFATPIFGSDTVRIFVNAMLKRIAGLAL